MKSNNSLLCLMTILINFGCINTTSSQQLILKLSPNIYTSFGTYYQHISTSNNNTIEVLPISNLGNVTWTNVNFGLQIDFLKFNNAVELGFFISNVESQNGYKVSYFSKPTDFPNTGKSSIFDYQLKTNYSRVDFGLSTRYNLDVNNQEKKRLKHSVVLQTMFSMNKSTSSKSMFNGETLVDGNIFYSDSIDNEKQSKFGIAINLRYEYEVISKKNRNILTLILGYRQGLTVTNRSVFQVWHSNGMSVNITSLSKSSAFFIGITKPINIFNKYH